MENLEAKVEDLENKMSSNILIPRIVFWTLVVTILLGIVGNFIFTWNSVRHIQQDVEVSKTKFEKDIQILELKFNKDNELVLANKELFKIIKDDLNEIKSTLKLKQDKKWVE